MTYKKVAALYDIHGNLPALEAVLREVKESGAEAVVVGGDVMPGPMPNECLAALRALAVPVHSIRGNGDRATLAVRAGEEEAEVPPRFRDVIEWAASQLTDEEAQFVQSWPAITQLQIDGRTNLFCHATPRNDTEIFTRQTPEDRLLPIFGSVDAELVVCGHTHMQFDRMVGKIRLINAGSIGMPFG